MFLTKDKHSRRSTEALPQPARHQLHFWISEDDYVFLRSSASADEGTISQVVRRLIREARRKDTREGAPPSRAKS
jgi:hypothetical protein